MLFFEVNALIVIIDRHGQGNFGVILADDIVVHIVFDLLGRGQGVGQLEGGRLGDAHIVPQNARAQLHALIADGHIGSGNDPVHLLLPLAAEGAADGLSSQGGTSFPGPGSAPVDDLVDQAICPGLLGQHAI